MSTAKTAATGIGLLLNLIEAASRVSLLIRQAHLEGRELTASELDGLRAEAQAARALLEDATPPGS